MNKSTRFLPTWKNNGPILKHTWEGLGNIDQMRWIERADMQNQLITARDELKIKHVRAVGMFDDHLRVYGRDPQMFRSSDKLRKRINWRNVNGIFDFLNDNGFCPMVTTCFTPSSMASGQKTVFENSNITPPADITAWENMINDLLLNMESRYGRENMRQWYYEVWNEPNLDSFWTGGMDAYFDMYRRTFDQLKKFDPELKIGGPSTARAEFIGEFLNYSDRNSCPPDYIIGHCYNNDSASKPLSPFNGPDKDRENNSPNFTSGVVKGTYDLLLKNNFKGEIHWNEWGLSWYPHRWERETPNEAAFVIKTMAEVSQLGDYFAYWCLSDIYDQVGFGRETFHGNYGMMSLDGLRKPAWLAHQLLGMMGTEIVEITSENQNEHVGAFISRSEKEIDLLFYAFDINFKLGNTPDKVKVECLLPSEMENAVMECYRIDSSENNILNVWHKMGSPVYPNKEELLQLKKNDRLKVSTDKPAIFKEKENYYLDLSLELPGVVMVRFKLA